MIFYGWAGEDNEGNTVWGAPICSVMDSEPMEAHQAAKKKVEEHAQAYLEQRPELGVKEVTILNWEVPE